MKSAISILFVVFSMSVNALETGFIITLDNKALAENTIPKNLFASSRFDRIDLNEKGESFSVSYLVRNTKSGEIVFEGDSNISSGQQSISLGTEEKGQLGLNYDSDLKQVNTYFCMKLPDGTYEVIVKDSSRTMQDKQISSLSTN